jgi:hypothetical protein
VDLFPVPASELSDKSAMDIEHQASSSNHMDYASSAPSPYSPEAHQHFTYPPPNVYAGQQNSVPMPPPPVHVPQQTNSGYHPPSGNLEAVAHVGNHPITEHSKCTNALVGQTFVQPANVDYKGQKSLMFVFAVGGPSLLLCLPPLINLNAGPCREDRGYIHSPLSCL